MDTFTLRGQICKTMSLLNLQSISVRFCNALYILAFSFITCSSTAFLQAQDKIDLREDYKIHDTYLIETKSTQQGELDIVADGQNSKLPKRLRKAGHATSVYLEKILSTDAKNLGTKTLRRYSQLEATQKIGDETVQAGLRSSIRHIVFDRQTSQAVTFSPDGPLLLGELEQARSDVFLPRLSGLLPANPVKQGDFWKPELSAVQELTDLQEITRNDLECILHSVEGDLAVVQFRGQVEGTTPTGSHLQTMQGSYQFQLRERRLKSIRLEVTSTLKSKEGKPAGNITATYELVRKPASSQLEADGLVLEPTEENTLLLVQEPKFGLEMVHSRRWVPRLPTEKNWQIDGPSGSGITIQFENSSAVSSAQDMRKPIETTLIKAVPDLKALADPPGWPSVERLAWQGTQNGKEYVFEYLLWKQKAAGAIIAARYFAPESELARKDVERMIRSLKRE